MRRKEKEITDVGEMEAVLSDAAVCHLGMVDGGEPYIVPLSFGYRNNTLYFHSAGEGRKIDILKRAPRVCFEAETDVEVVKGETECDWTVNYRSVMGTGEVRFLEDLEEKWEALSVISEHYGGERTHYPEDVVRRTTVFTVGIRDMTGKSG